MTFFTPSPAIQSLALRQPTFVPSTAKHFPFPDQRVRHGSRHRVSRSLLSQTQIQIFTCFSSFMRTGTRSIIHVSCQSSSFNPARPKIRNTSISNGLLCRTPTMNPPLLINCRGWQHDSHAPLLLSLLFSSHPVIEWPPTKYLPSRSSSPIPALPSSSGHRHGHILLRDSPVMAVLSQPIPSL